MDEEDHVGVFMVFDVEIAYGYVHFCVRVIKYTFFLRNLKKNTSLSCFMEILKRDDEKVVALNMNKEMNDFVILIKIM